MESPEYFRKRNIIQGPDGVKFHGSVNEAKKASREIQMSKGSLGCGILEVVNKLPEVNDG